MKLSNCVDQNDKKLLKCKHKRENENQIRKKKGFNESNKMLFEKYNYFVLSDF